MNLDDRPSADRARHRRRTARASARPDDPHLHDASTGWPQSANYSAQQASIRRFPRFSRGFGRPVPTGMQDDQIPVAPPPLPVFSPEAIAGGTGELLQPLYAMHVMLVDAIICAAERTMEPPYVEFVTYRAVGRILRPGTSRRSTRNCRLSTEECPPARVLPLSGLLDGGQGPSARAGRPCLRAGIHHLRSRRRTFGSIRTLRSRPLHLSSPPCISFLSCC